MAPFSMADGLKIPPPPSMTGLSALLLQPLVSGRDGTAALSLEVLGTGVGTCKGRVEVYDAKMEEVLNSPFEITPAGGFPKVVQIAFPRPGKFQLMVQGHGNYGECPGKGTMTVTIKAHPDYPCSLYPNFRKSVWSESFACVPSQPPANVKRFPELCPPGTKFVDHYGYVFGCIAPALDAIAK
jgi:hypothetical protein